jgi:hypothetical protein
MNYDQVRPVVRIAGSEGEVASQSGYAHIFISLLYVALLTILLHIIRAVINNSHVTIVPFK